MRVEIFFNSYKFKDISENRYNFTVAYEMFFTICSEFDLKLMISVTCNFILNFVSNFTTVVGQQLKSFEKQICILSHVHSCRLPIC